MVYLDQFISRLYLIVRLWYSLVQSTPVALIIDLVKNGACNFRDTASVVMTEGKNRYLMVDGMVYVGI